jgi:hypothetical protein
MVGADSPVTIAANISSDQPLTSVTVYLDGNRIDTEGGGRSETQQAFFTSRQLSAGQHAVRAVATDEGGETGKVSWQFTVRMTSPTPAAKPTLTNLTPAPGATVAGTEPVTIAANVVAAQPLASTQVYLDGLPDERAGDLDGLLDAWRAEREKQRERLVAYLDGKRYRRFVERTKELLDGPVEALAPQNLLTPRPQRVAQVLPGVPAVLRPGGDLVALVKPQFEAGREEVGRKGIVRDPAVHERVVERVTQAAAGHGLVRAGLVPSPITGAEGNVEFLLHLRRP